MTASPPATRCPECGTEIAPGLLACPSCRRLVYADELKRFADSAARATAEGNLTLALESWREAMHRLPSDSRQYETIAARVAELSRQVDASGSTPPAPKPAWAARGGIVGVAALFLWKFKFLLAFVLTKGKLLLLGLTKGSTFFSMLLSLSVYWRAFGWKWAAGVVGSIYIHEMGHVAMMRRFGIPFAAPMFIPGVGAVIRSRLYPKEAIADARIGLAGPIWGLGAAVAAYLVYLATDLPAWGALAEVGAWINLFNLLPVWFLDGARGFRALSRVQRWVATAGLAVMWYMTAEGLLVLLMVVAAGASWLGTPAERPDRRTLIEYLVLVVVLSIMTTIPVPMTALRP